MSLTKPNDKIRELIFQFGSDEIQCHLDQSLEDIITAADMDKKLKKQLKIIFGLKRAVGAFREPDDAPQ